MKTKTNLIKYYLIITISIFFFLIVTFSNSFAIDIATDFQTIKDAHFLSLSPDGKYLASKSKDETTKIWKFSDGRFSEIQTLKGHFRNVSCLSFSPDSKYIASVCQDMGIKTFTFSKDRTIKIWKLSGGRFSEIQTIKGHFHTVYCLSFSPDSKYIASGIKNKTIKIWELSGGRFSEIQTLKGHSDVVVSLSFSPDGKYLASKSRDNIKIWKLSDDRFSEIQTFPLKWNFLYEPCISFSPDGKYLASKSRDNIKIWKLSDDRFSEIQTLKGHSDVVVNLSFSPDGKYLACGSRGNIKICKLSDGKFEELQNIKEHSGRVANVSFTNVFFIKNSSLFVSVGFLGSHIDNIVIEKWNYREVFYIYSLKKLIAPSKNIEINYNKEMLKKTTNLCKPKGEFETQTQYDERIKIEKKQKHQFEELYAEKKRKEMEKIQNKINQQLMITFPVSFSSIQLGKYNTEKEEFPITINGKTENVKVPLNSARDFKENKGNYQIIGERKYYLTKRDEIKSEIINVKIKTPEGQVYAFGKQTEHTKQTYAEKSILPPKLEITSLNFTDENNDNWLSGDETGKIIINIENNGKGSAYGLIAKIKPKGKYNFLNYVEQQIITELKPDGKKTLEFLISADYNTPQQNCEFSITFEEANGFHPNPVNFSFQTKKFVPPVFFVEKGITDASGNFAIEKSEIVKVTVRLANTGGQAKDVSLSVKKGNNVFFAGDTESRFTWDTIEKGDFKDISFDFYTNKKVKDEIPLSVIVQADHYSQEFPLNLKIKQREISPQSFAFKGKDIVDKDINIPSLVVDIEENIPKCKTINKDAVAVVIGNRNYTTGDVPPVEFAKRDANFVKEYLINTLGYREGNIIYVTDASQADFNSIFGTDKNHKGKLYNYVKSAQSDIFIYYSGHGAPDPESKNGYFVPVDCDPSLVALNGYLLNTFYANLSKIDYKSLTVVIDACFSGSSEGGMLLKDISPIFIKVDNPVTAKGNSIVFTSATAEQVSSWYPDMKHSLFTYYFLKALQVNADKNNDNNLTVGEIKNYIDDNVPYMARRLNNREQTPQVIGDLDKIIVKY